MSLMPRYRVNGPDVVHQTIDGEAVIIHLARGFYYSLDKVGADVWAAIHERKDLSALLAALKARYTHTGTDLERAVVDFVEALRREELVVEDSVDRASDTAESAANGAPDSARVPFEPPVLHRYTDLQDLLSLDPIHQVDEAGWPEPRPGQIPGSRP